MLLRDLLDELDVPSFAYITTVQHGALGHRLREVVESHPEADVDLRLEVVGGEAFVTIMGVVGESIVHESTVALGVVSALPERARVILMVWGLAQDRRARVRWVTRTNRKLVALGLRPIDLPR